MPYFAVEKMNLTPDQQERLAKLEKEVKAKLDKILTLEQQKALDAARPPLPGSPDGRPGFGRPGRSSTNRGAGPRWMPVSWPASRYSDRGQPRRTETVLVYDLGGVGDRLVVLFLLAVQFAAVAERERMVGIEANRLVEVGQCLGELFLGAPENAAIVNHGGIRRVK